MSIVHNYNSIGKAYHKLTDGWLPREEPARLVEPAPRHPEQVTACREGETLEQSLQRFHDEAIRISGKDSVVARKYRELSYRIWGIRLKD